VLLQNRKGYLTDKELDKQMNEILEARVAAEEELRKARQQLERPEQVKAAVKAATQMVSDDINVELTYWEYLDRGTEFYELPYEERLRIEREEPDHPMMKLERRIKEVRARLKDREEEVEKLTKKEIKDWIFLQKRRIIELFLGPGGHIRVNPNKEHDYTVEVNGSISLQNIPANVFSYKSS